MERAAERFGGVGKKVSKYDAGSASIECESQEIPCRPKQIRTISFFLKIICSFEFNFRRCGLIFSDDSNFWCVRGSITHNATEDVIVLWPVCTHNSISNVVVSVTIHDVIKMDMYMYMCVFVHPCVYGCICICVCWKYK